jgi:hypothetical protein
MDQTSRNREFVKRPSKNLFDLTGRVAVVPAGMVGSVAGLPWAWLKLACELRTLP